MEGKATPNSSPVTDVHWQLASERPEVVANISSVTGLSRDEVVDRLFKPGEPQTIRIQPLGGAEVTVRPGTSDILVLIDTFVSHFHLPASDVKPRVILDLGSNIGTTIAHFAYLYENAHVFGVELDAENAELCAKNIALWGDRCQVVQAAVAATDGMSQYDDRLAGNEWGWGFRIGSGTSSVRTVSIDTLLGQFNLGEIDYLKMDIEGTEREVLQSGGRWQERVRSLKVELHKPYTVEAAFEDLEKLGFVCERDDAHWACVVARRIG